LFRRGNIGPVNKPDRGSSWKQVVFRLYSKTGRKRFHGSFQKVISWNLSGHNEINHKENFIREGGSNILFPETSKKKNTVNP
jgi:hypothetical protein